MKRITSLLLVMMIFTAGLAAADTITVRADSWPPYNDEPDSTQPGYMIEAAKLIFEAKGHEIDYKLMPWTRSLDSVRKGTYDAVVGTDPEESPDFVFPKEGFGINQNGFYVKQGNSWQYSGISSLQGLKLGIIEGYGYYETIDNYIAANENSDKIFAATGDDALPKLLKMLKSGRVDAVIENINVMPLALKDAKLENEIIAAGVDDERQDLFMAFSPAKESSKEYIQIFDEGLVELRSSGKFQEILSRYGLKDWK